MRPVTNSRKTDICSRFKDVWSSSTNSKNAEYAMSSNMPMGHKITMPLLDVIAVASPDRTSGYPSVNNLCSDDHPIQLHPLRPENLVLELSAMFCLNQMSRCTSYAISTGGRSGRAITVLILIRCTVHSQLVQPQKNSTTCSNYYYYCRRPQTVAFNGTGFKSTVVRIRARACSRMTGMDEGMSESLIQRQIAMLLPVLP